MPYYYRQRRGTVPWVMILVVVLLASGGYITRHTLERRAAPLLQRVVTATSPAVRASAAILPGPTPTFTVALQLPKPLADVPDPSNAAAQYLDAWQASDYPAMYALLSNEARQGRTEAQFVSWYQDLTSEATIESVAPKITSAPVVPDQAGNGASVQVPFTVTFKTIRVGSFSENNSVPVILEHGQWRIDWRPALFFKDLEPGDLVHLFPLNPTRGSILDRKNRPLATMGYVVTIGVIPKDLKKNGQEDATLNVISGYLKKSPDDLKKMYAGKPEEWFIPLGDVPSSQEKALQQGLSGRAGVVLRHKPIRVYPQGEVASHVVGYVGHVTDAELKTLATQGYTIDDIVGRAGVERWAEPMLAGRRGGKLAILNPKTREVMKIIAQRDAVPGEDVVLSIDLDIQKVAESVLTKLDGSVVVMDPSDNSVLALAAYPNFDPNKFVTGFTPQEWNAINTSPDRPLLDRPTEAKFASGSIFKPITTAAAMTDLGTKPSDVFDCSYWWSGPAGMRLHNWEPQGHLNLIQSITGSCDPTFYTLGLALQRKDPNLLPEMARAFGLGQKTGINGVDEIAGTLPDPAWKKRVLGQPWYEGDTINLSIGQGFLEVTPLQMANVYSTIANSGLRRSPILVQKVLDYKGNVVQTFTAAKVGQVPVAPEVWQTIHEGMLGVTSTPLGTAYYAFKTYPHPMRAKTGSAENQGPLAHAWFAGYAPPDNPKYVILVMVEGRGESMEIASPMARNLMDFLWPPDPTPSPTGSAPPSRPAASSPMPASATTPAPKPTAVPSRAPVQNKPSPGPAAPAPTPKPAIH